TIPTSYQNSSRTSQTFLRRLLSLLHPCRTSHGGVGSLCQVLHFRYRALGTHRVLLVHSKRSLHHPSLVLSLLILRQKQHLHSQRQVNNPIYLSHFSSMDNHNEY